MPIINQQAIFSKTKKKTKKQQTINNKQAQTDKARHQEQQPTAK